MLIAFGLPFLGMGLFAAFSFLNAKNQSGAGKYAAAVFAFTFALIGGGLIFGAIYGYGKQKKQSQIEAAYPTSPWLWRPDWASSRVDSKNKSSAVGWWIAAFFVHMWSVPICLLVVPQFERTHDPKLVLPMGVELIGLIVLAGAIRATMRLNRFGKTYFELGALPFSPGGHVSGSIHAQLTTDVPHGIDLALSCVRRVVTGSGNNRSTQQIPLWEDSKNISAGYLSRGPLDTIIPVDFALPQDAFQTDTENLSDRVLWILKASADVPGVDYLDEFELPVFCTSQVTRQASTASSPASLSFTTAGDFATNYGFARASGTTSEVEEPPQHRVVISETGDGQEFYFPAGRNVGRAILISSLALGCLALSYFLTRTPHVPIFAFVVVALMDFVFTMAAVHVALSTSRIVVTNGSISWQRAIFGLGQTHKVGISEVDSVLATTSIQQAGSSGKPLYSLQLKTKAGKSFTLVDEIENRQEARWIVTQIEKRAGIRLDDHVEINNSFYGPPPQPQATSQSSSNMSGGIKTSSRRGSFMGTAIGTAMFAAWIGFVAMTIFRGPAGHRAHTNAATARQRELTPINFVRTAAMKQTSLENVLTWPAQQQAEEIMARCAEHNAAALASFDQQTTTWVGKIRLTDNLRQLEDRTRYSNDLRVRKAEANLELTLAGWSESTRSVDMLIESAKSDAQARPSALYFLGVLAGDGIEAQQAHAFVLDYAKNNADAEARKWATEGLQFVGTDPALDELFDIFTHDPSFSVRDRAGCNISDCGLFERKQRWRMVPGLTDLLADPKTNSQMRNWAFLALREITDENLPADALAWRKWYEERGAAKQAEFEKLDWWQVRGNS